jgi:hypothetical protein
MNKEQKQHLDDEMLRTREQLLHLAKRAQMVGHVADAVRLYRAYRYLCGDTEIRESEMITQLRVTHHREKC